MLFEKKIRKNWEKKSVDTDRIPGDILKLAGEAMNPYVARTLKISLNNAKIPRDWKIFTTGSYLQKGLSMGTLKL